LIIVLICGLGTPLAATHIIGGNFEVTHIAGNSYQVKLTIFKDCNPGTAILADMNVFVYDAVTYSQQNSITMKVPEGDTLTLGDRCYTPPSLCVEEYTFLDTISLTGNPNGYIISAQTCCRNYIIDNINNPGNTGMTWTIEVPDPSMINNSPKLGPYPQEGFLCLNVLRTMDLSAKDPDGDSLFYRLVNPYASSPSGNTTPPPYSPVSWKPGYSANNAISGNPSLEINNTTGLLKCNASQLGVYVFAYSVSEYRNGMKIGETRRDMQLQVLPNCNINFKPEFVLPEQTSYSLSATDEICLPVVVVDSNSTDSIYLTSYYTTDSDKLLLEEPSTLKRIGTGEISGQICYRANCVDVGSTDNVQLHLRAHSYNCKLADTARKTITIALDPLPADIESLFPNIFTPNSDGANDYFNLTDPEAIPCIEGMQIRIFNRWGRMVYENYGQSFKWDGTFEAQDVAEGVYFFTVEGTYSDKSFFFKNFLTLMR